MRFMSQNELTHKMANLRDENKTGWTKQYITPKDKIWLILGQIELYLDTLAISWDKLKT